MEEIVNRKYSTRNIYNQEYQCFFCTLDEISINRSPISNCPIGESVQNFVTNIPGSLRKTENMIRIKIKQATFQHKYFQFHQLLILQVFPDVSIQYIHINLH